MESKTLIAENPICMKVVVLMHGKLLLNWKLERLQLSIALFSLSMTQEKTARQRPSVHSVRLFEFYSHFHLQSPYIFLSKFQKRSFDEVSCSICVQKGHVSSKNCFGWLVKNTKYSAFIQLWPQTLVSSLKICCCRKMREIWHRGVLLTQDIWCGFLWPYLIFLVFIFCPIE